MDSSKRAELMARVETEMQANFSQNIVQIVTDRCFEKCVYSPGKELSNKEKDCTSKCMDRFIDAMNVISDTLRNRSNILP
mmetsp:Transcript_7847/g.23700  ORF Transcript_7847/g.23700 Transcript_7847/m.23700 type:complete len:80 (+) Transcript_7847:423-662(+)|eukprot:CAMPEP_0198726510 /NCGR_PEP_ID=MMETSP1475-20131203/3541_1 /TAXON_ID= ORGANISM="Unidentified sp., Strain CCMP1999" /NCGR_SAMPLE_ID=MMETSP1475 /ASSEMBLY_ACC=CAM_ASM_001111 /LENGTH=79 /DNA_ID=CAMNT_0044488435 /DNA_START=345 /DNA_END=584 /DNA_ORIENTATION=-